MKIKFIFLILCFFVLFEVNSQENDSSIVINTFIKDMRENNYFQKFYRKNAIPKSVTKTLKSIDKKISFSNPGHNHVFTDVVNWKDRFFKNRELICVYKSDKIVVIHYYFNGVKLKRCHKTLICYYNNKHSSVVSVGVVFQDISDLYLKIISNNYFISNWI